MEFLITVTLQKVVDDKTAQRASRRTLVGLQDWLRDNREDGQTALDLDSAVIEAISSLVED